MGDDYCPDCQASKTVVENIVEHAECGCVGPDARFADGCPECGEAVEPSALTAVQSVRRCLDCGARWTPREEDSEAVPAVSPFNLDAYRTDATARSSSMQWIRETIGAKPAVVLMVLLIGLVGVGGAAVVTPMLADDPADADTGVDTGADTEVDREWVEYETVVVFRNDDIQPGYKQETLRAVDQIFIDEDVPVTLGVIPVVGGDDMELTEDGELCTYLRSLLTTYPGQFEMALHGYTHGQVTDFHGGSEFGGVDAATQQEWMTDGTTLLSACTGVEPRTFIPPMNTYDNQTVAAASKAGYTTMSGGDWFTNSYYNETGIFTADGLLHISEGASMIDDWETNELYSQAELNAQFDRSYEANEPHIQMLHYQSFDSPAEREKLRSLIQHMKTTDSAFLTLDQLAAGLESGDIRETDDGWEVREPLRTDPAAPDRRSDDTAETGDTGPTSDVGFWPFVSHPASELRYHPVSNTDQ